MLLTGCTRRLKVCLVAGKSLSEGDYGIQLDPTRKSTEVESAEPLAVVAACDRERRDAADGVATVLCLITVAE